jgi:hypothetical protein
MRKLSYFLSITAMAAMVTFSACKKDKEETTTETTCADEVYPTTSGTATVSFKNFANSAGTVQAGDIIAIAVEVTKGSQRPQKIRVYQTDCDKAKGDLLFFQGQAKTNNAGDEIDLANTDDAQVRTINYTVPSGMSPIYLNFEIDESGSKYTYKQLVLTVSGSGIVDTRTVSNLGSQGHATYGSRMSSALGYVYTACEIPQNLDQIDIVYAVSKTSPYKSYLCSNPARSTMTTNDYTSGANVFGDATAGNLTYSANYSATCLDDAGAATGSYTTGGGKSTYFKAYAGSSYATADDAVLSALTVSSSDNQYVEFTANDQIFEFLNANGKKGLIKVTSVGTLGNTNNAINVEVKVQR